MSGKLNWITKLMFIMVFCLTACQPTTPTVSHDEVTVSEQTLGNDLYYSGLLEPKEVVNIPSPVDGLVAEKQFEYGQPVRANQPVLVINSEELTKQYAQALQEYLSNKDKLAKAESELKSSTELLSLGIIPKSRFVSDKSNYDNARITFQRSLYSLKKLIQEAGGQAPDLSRLDIANFQAVDEALRVKYNHLVIRSPASGVALIPHGESGSNNDRIEVGSKLKVGEILLSVGDMNGISVTINVNEVDIDHIKPGQAVVITGVAFPDIQLNGTVDRVASQATAVSGMSGGLPNFQVKVVVPQLPAPVKQVVRVGMTVKIKLVLTKTKRLMLPIKAVRHHHGKDWVQLKTADGYQDQEVITGESTPQQVEIVKGLKTGDVVRISRARP